jgi:hypothetical protein
MCDNNESNVINLMIFIGMLKMNYMVSGLIILHMYFRKWNVVQYVEQSN